MKLRYVMLGLWAMSGSAVQAQWLDAKTPGIPRTADGNPDLDAPAPRTADGKPELTGLWRVLSFLLMGLSFLGISWAYARFVFGIGTRRQDPPAPPAPPDAPPPPQG